jgi:RNA polymerase sigma-70 factor (ECF subfamily)
VKRARHHRRTAARRRQALARLEKREASETNPERDLYRRELGARLARALDDLPHDQRVAFVLCEVEGLTAGEAAPIADAPEATMRTRLFHARRKLRERLARERAE